MDYSKVSTAATATSSRSRRARNSQPLLTEVSAQAQKYVRLMARASGVTEEDIMEGAVMSFGSVENAAVALRIETDQLEELYASEKAALEAAFPPGQRHLVLGDKPATEDQVSCAPLAHGVSIRVWGGNLAPCRLFSFDFVNKAGRYIRTPDDIKIYSVANGFTPCLEVHSIEKSLELADPHNSPNSLRNYGCDPSKADKNWETYIVPEGTLLRIVQLGQDDRFLQIPTRLPQDAFLTLQPI